MPGARGGFESSHRVPRLDPARRPVLGAKHEPGGSDPAGRTLTAQHFTTMADKQPSFSERIARLEEASEHLEDVACILRDEVEHMQAAEKRFAERRGARNAKASR